jgi:23S rRNA (cytosine1962-C5)-methyltransferase
MALAALEARAPLVDSSQTNAYVWADRDHDGFPDLTVERLGDVALALRTDEREGPLPSAWTGALMEVGQLAALVEQRLPRRGKRGPFQVVAGALPEPRFTVRELGLTYEVDLGPEQTSGGLFLDQRETRWRLANSDLRGKTLLNAFAHTGSLSVAAASAGAETLTLDLSQRYLEWARENLRHNGLDPADHDFIYGDALDWMRRLTKKGRRFDVVLVDPPSFATGAGRRKKDTWSVERDLGTLIERGARLVAPGGTLFVSTNLRRLTWAKFAAHVQAGLRAAGRTAEVEPATLPLDRRTGAGDPPYLKLAWLSLD